MAGAVIEAERQESSGVDEIMIRVSMDVCAGALPLRLEYYSIVPCNPSCTVGI